MKYLILNIAIIFCCFAFPAEGNGKADSLVSNGYELIALRDYNAALDNFSRAVDIDPDNVRSYLGRANVERILGNYEKALKDVHKALSIDGHAAESHYTKGMIHKNMKKYQEAIIDFNTALEHDQNLLKANAAKASVYILMDETREAEKILEQGINEDPSFGDYYFYRGKLYAERNKYEKAVESFNTTFDRETNVSKLEIYLNRGEAYLNLNLFIKAKGDFEKALIIEPMDASALHGLGVANYNLENYQEALDDFFNSIRIIKNNPERYDNNPETYYNIGMTYYRMEEPTKACKYFHIGCKMNNKNSCKMVILQCTGD